MRKEKSYGDYLFGLSDVSRECLLQKLREIEEIESLQDSFEARRKREEAEKEVAPNNFNIKIPEVLAKD